MFNYNVLAASLREAGYDGSFNDSLYQYFATTYGITTGQLNDLLYYHLGQLGYTGSLGDRLNLWDGTLLQGAWYDPSDLTSMFQDAAGTTPAVVGQPVGLILDKRLGLVLGPELVSNPGPAFVATTGWSSWRTAALSVVGGKLRVTNVNAYGGAYQALTTVVGATYKLVVSVTDPTNLFYIYIASAGPETGIFINQSNNSAGTYTIHFVAVSTTTYVTIGNQQVTVGHTMDLVSATVKLLDGNHAKQSTAAARPVLSARVNLLTYSEQFDNAAWLKQANTVVTPNQVAAPDGAVTADLVVSNGADGIYVVGIPVSATSNNTKSIWLKTASGTATVNLKDPQATVGTTVCNLTTSWQRFSLSETQTGGLAGLWVSNIPASGIYVWGAQVESGTTATRYQRVTTATDYDTVGFPSKIDYDGIDDLLTASNPNLGANVTIARATATGASILTGQTVGANYVDSTDHYGLILINRALTAAETASVTTYLNMKAGL